MGPNCRTAREIAAPQHRHGCIGRQAGHSGLALTRRDGHGARLCKVATLACSTVEEYRGVCGWLQDSPYNFPGERHQAEQNTKKKAVRKIQPKEPCRVWYRGTSGYDKPC